MFPIFPSLFLQMWGKTINILLPWSALSEHKMESCFRVLRIISRKSGLCQQVRPLTQFSFVYIKSDSILGLLTWYLFILLLRQINAFSTLVTQTRPSWVSDCTFACFQRGRGFRNHFRRPLSLSSPASCPQATWGSDDATVGLKSQMFKLYADTEVGNIKKSNGSTHQHGSLWIARPI